VFPHRFLPSPVPFHRSSHGVRLVDVQHSAADRHKLSPYYGTLYQRIQFHGIVMRHTQSQLLPFDAFCPSVVDQLQSRLCTICKQYLPSAVRLRNHYKVHQQRFALYRTDSTTNIHKKEDDELVDDNEPVDPSDLPVLPTDFSQHGVFLFSDMVEWVRSEFEDDPVVESKPKSSAATASAMIRMEKQRAMNTAESVCTPAVESIATIAVDSALSSDSPTQLIEVKREPESVLINVEQTNMTPAESILGPVSNSVPDDLDELIERI
jgi:hypothetical protein